MGVRRRVLPEFIFGGVAMVMVEWLNGCYRLPLPLPWPWWNDENPAAVGGT